MKSGIVTTEELAAHPEWRVFDCRYELRDPQRGRALYAEGHIPGALYADLERDLSGPKTGRNGRHPLPAPNAFIAWLGAHGLRNADQVVAYDNAGTAFAARLWWMLKWLGHDAVAVLDGGFEQWTRERRPVTTDVPVFAPTSFAGRAHDAMWVGVDDVLRNVASRENLIVDARAAGRYAGVEETIDPVAGHIPGAVNRPYLDNVDAQGRFKSAPELRAAFEQILRDLPPSRMVSQCGSGVTACHNLLAMHLAGLYGGRLYPGSWSEWCSDGSRPIATGTEPG